MAFSVDQALVSPGVFTETFLDVTAAELVGLARVPFVVGPGDEELEVTDFQIYRGSSAVADQLVYREDLSDQIDVPNSNRVFYVDNSPIVSGNGLGETTDDPSDVVVLQNGRRIPAIQLDGSLGKITLATVPLADDTLTVTYSYRRKDTLLEDQDISNQADGTATQFKLPVIPVVAGDDGGTITTDTSNIIVTVDGTAVTVSTLDGASGLVTLASPPAAGSTVLATYYTNKWQNTFDEVEYDISRVIRVGLQPGRVDFTSGTDYVVFGNRVYWGTFAYVMAALTAAGTEPLDEDYILASTVDDHKYLEVSEDIPDGSRTLFHTEQVPTDGTGKDTPADALNLLTPTIQRLDMVKAYVGPDPVTAFGAGEVLLRKIVADDRTRGLSREIHLDVAPPAPTYSSGTATITTPPAYAGGEQFTIDGKTFGIDLRAFITFTFDSVLWNTMDGTTITIDDEVNPPVTFEFDNNSTLSNPNHVPVTIDMTASPVGEVNTATNFAAAVSLKALDGSLNVSVAQVGAQVTVTNIVGGLVTDFFATTATTGAVPGATQLLINPGDDFDGFSAATDYSFSEEDTDDLTAANLATAVNAADVDVEAEVDSITLNQVNLTATRQSGDDIVLTESTGGAPFAVSGAGTLTGAVDSYVFLSYYQGRIIDNKAYTVEVTRSGKDITQVGPGLVGQFTVTDDNGNTVREVIEATTLNNVADPNFPGTAAWPAGEPVLHTDPENGIDETVTITFTSATAFTVSSDQPSGSTGTGYIGQTYFDSVTGLWFTLGDPQNPANTSVLYNYALGDKIVLQVRTTHNVSLEFNYSVPGTRFIFASSDEIAVGNKATLWTFDKEGTGLRFAGGPTGEPLVGEAYYISYVYEKGDEFFEPRVFTSRLDGRDVLGNPDVGNPIALGFDLCFQNNLQATGVLQVRRPAEGEEPGSQAYIDAFDQLARILPGGTRVETVTPLTSDSFVLNGLKAHVEKLSGPLWAMERRAIVGAPIGQTPNQATTLAQALKSNRLTYIYTGGGGMLYRQPDALGRELDFPVDSVYAACAFAGLDTAVAFDQAEPMTRKQIFGFIRALGAITEPDANLLVNKGVTVIDDLEPTFEVRHHVTTDGTNTLTKEGNVTKITDLVQVRQREALRTFIGTKKLAQRAGEIEQTLSNLFNQLVNTQIIADYKGSRVYTDPATPTGFIVESRYAPVLPLNYITVRNFVSTT